MRDLWRRLEEYLKHHAPSALGALNPPATDREIRDAESQMGMRFPLDLVETLRIHNGQIQETGVAPHPVPFIPQEYEEGGIYRATFGELAPVEMMVNRTLDWRKILENQRPDWSADCEYDGPVRRDGDWSWLIFVDSGSGDMLGLDLKPPGNGQFGQVLSIIHDPSCLLVLAPSFRHWFETLVTRFESGRYYFEDQDGELEVLDRFQARNRRDSDRPDGEDILRFPR